MNPTSYSYILYHSAEKNSAQEQGQKNKQDQEYGLISLL